MSKGLSSVKTLSAKEIAKKWDLPLSVVAKKIAAGVKIEKEHTKSTKQANEIARDHLGERPDYYDKLGKMEKTKIVKEMDTSRMPFSKNIEDRRPTTGQDWQSRILKAGSYVSGAIGDIKNATIGPDKPDMNLGKKAEPLNTGRPATPAKEGSTGDGRKEYGRFEDDPRSGEGYRTQTPGSWSKYTDSIASQGSSGRGTPGPVTPGSKGGSITTPKPPESKLEPEDVWSGGFNAKAKQPVVKEETGTSGVRGLGYVSGDPSVTNYVEKYVNTNVMSYQDVNGDKLKFIEKSHRNLHDRKLGFKDYDPTKIKSISNKDLAESLGSEYGTSAVPVVGDLTGTPRKVTKVDEVKLPTKARKAVATGMTLANLYTAGDVASRAQQGVGNPAKDMVTAASTLSGTKGWVAYGADKARQAYEYVKKNRQLKEDLRKWFRDKWVRYDTKGNIKGPCAREEGEGKPKCQPLASARAMSKEERAKSARRKRREDPVADRSGKGGKPIMVKTNEETLLEKNVPTNPALWARAKAQARSKFDVYPSAYANGWAAKWYKSKGGGWKTAKESVDEACWSTYKQVGVKKKGNKTVPNCVPKEERNIVPANSVERGIYEVKSYYASTRPKLTNVKRIPTATISKDSEPQKTNSPAMQAAFDRIAAAFPKGSIKVGARKNVKEEHLEETTLKKKVKYAINAVGQQSRIAKELRPDEVESDKTYQKRKKGLDRVFKESSQIDELSAEVVGRVSNARFWRGEAPSKTLSRAINKKFIESGQKKEDDTPFEGSKKRSHEKSSTHVRRLAVNAMKQYTKEETIMDTKDLINEALDNILEENLVAMKENLMAALQEKAMEKLEERKKIISSEYFAQ